jgi:Uma2 family endonuclease
MGHVPVFSHTHAASLTRADLESLPDDGYRYELVDGVLLMSPSPRPVHQRAVARLLAALVENCPREMEVLPAPVDVELAEDTVLIPDVVVGLRERFGERGLVGAPVLAVEVISRSSRLIDTKLKPARLAEAGCPFYWVVDPNVPRLWVYRLDGGSYVVVADVSGEEVVELREPYAVRLSADYLVAPYVE